MAGVAKNILQKVTLTRPFLLCDREVSVGLFQQFVDDPDYPVREKARNWPGADSDINPTAEHPVQRSRVDSCSPVLQLAQPQGGTQALLRADR